MDSTHVFGDFNVADFENSELFKCADKKLKENTWYKPLLDYLEYSTEINRVYHVTGSLSLLLATVFLIYGTQLICDVVGFLYPGYQTMKCLENFDVQQSKKWLRYWVVISAFIFIERFFLFLPLLPGYWFTKCIIFISCYNHSISGADIIYCLMIYPLYEKYQELLCSALDHFMMTTQFICPEEYVESNEMLMPRDSNEVQEFRDVNELQETRDGNEVSMVTDGYEVPKPRDDSEVTMYNTTTCRVHMKF